MAGSDDLDRLPLASLLKSVGFSGLLQTGVYDRITDYFNGLKS